MRKNEDRIAMTRRFANAPPNVEIDKRKARFEELNEFVQSRGGWTTNIPGSIEVTVEALPDSTLPDDLRARGYDLAEIGTGERILAHAITERFTRRVDGELEPLTAESTRPIAETRTHAGICRVRQYGFEMP
jgi:hypothetical protein